MNITKKNLVESLNKINEEIDECVNKKFNYITGERYLQGWSVISKVKTIKELLEIATYLIGQTSNTTEAEKFLGVTVDDEKEPTLCGYKVSEWKTDVKTRKAELDNVERIISLKKAKTILENNLSEDDKFALDMQKVATLIG